MKVALTGASGHIGNCLVRELCKRNFRDKAMVRSLDTDLSALNIELVQGDLMDIQTLEKLCYDDYDVFSDF